MPSISKNFDSFLTLITKHTTTEELFDIYNAVESELCERGTMGTGTLEEHAEVKGPVES